MNLSIKECLTFGWRTFKARPWFFVMVTVLVIGVSIVSSLVQNGFTVLFGKGIGGLVSLPIALIADMFIGMGMLSVLLKAHDAVMEPSLRDVWNPKPFWRYLGLLLVLFVLAFVVILACALLAYLYFYFVMNAQHSATAGDAFVLYILPFTIIGAEILTLLGMLPFVFAPFLVIDRGLRPIQALKESMTLTKGYRLKLLGLIVVLIVLNILGILLLLVGVLVSSPVASLAMVHAYRELSGSRPVQNPSTVLNLGAVV